MQTKTPFTISALRSNTEIAERVHRYVHNIIRHVVRNEASGQPNFPAVYYGELEDFNFSLNQFSPKTLLCGYEEPPVMQMFLFSVFNMMLRFPHIKRKSMFLLPWVRLYHNVPRMAGYVDINDPWQLSELQKLLQSALHQLDLIPIQIEILVIPLRTRNMQSGTIIDHTICVFVDLQTSKIELFDSSGHSRLFHGKILAFIRTLVTGHYKHIFFEEHSDKDLQVQGSCAFYSVVIMWLRCYNDFETTTRFLSYMVTSRRIYYDFVQFIIHTLCRTIRSCLLAGMGDLYAGDPNKKIILDDKDSFRLSTLILSCHEEKETSFDMPQDITSAFEMFDVSFPVTRVNPHPNLPDQYHKLAWHMADTLVRVSEFYPLRLSELSSELADDMRISPMVECIMLMFTAYNQHIVGRVFAMFVGPPVIVSHGTPMGPLDIMNSDFDRAKLRDYLMSNQERQKVTNVMTTLTITPVHMEWDGVYKDRVSVSINDSASGINEWYDFTEKKSGSIFTEAIQDILRVPLDVHILGNAPSYYSVFVAWLRMFNGYRDTVAFLSKDARTSAGYQNMILLLLRNVRKTVHLCVKKALYMGTDLRKSVNLTRELAHRIAIQLIGCDDIQYVGSADPASEISPIEALAKKYHGIKLPAQMLRFAPTSNMNQQRMDVSVV